MLLASKLRNWRQALLIVQPGALLRWHRDLFRWEWRQVEAKAKARLATIDRRNRGVDKANAEENGSWGAERIRGEQLKLGMRVSKSSIRKYIQEVRRPREPKQTWLTFLRNHPREIWACDFLQTYDIFFRMLFVFVIIELGSRRLIHFGVTKNRTDAWLAEQLREATPFGEGPCYLARDDDSRSGRLVARVTSGTEIYVPRNALSSAEGKCDLRAVSGQPTARMPRPFPDL